MRKTATLLIAALLALTLATGESRAVSGVALMLNGTEVKLAAQPYLSDEGRTFVPIRFVSEQLGYTVDWNADERSVTVHDGGTKLYMIVGEKSAEVNGAAVALDSAVALKDSSVFVPLRFILEQLGADVTWDPATHRVEMTTEPWFQTRTVRANNRSFTVQIAHLPAGSPLRVGLADGRIGQTAEFAGFAGQAKAVAAINGAYFEAYGGVPEPWGTLIDGGELIHAGTTGTAVGFTADGQAKMDTVRIKIEGYINGKYGWYAYNFNRSPSGAGNAVYVYNKHRGQTTRVSSGAAVTVEQGKVTAITRGKEVAIPDNGYVIQMTGSETKLADKFAVGQEVSYKLIYTNVDGETLDWSDVRTAVGAGPRLVKNGQVAVNPQAEGFTESKILTDRGARSGIGVKPYGTVMLATVSGATMQEWALIMRQLGAQQAMNLDGGASSGLYFGGQVRTKPGRELSNIVYVQ